MLKTRDVFLVTVRNGLFCDTVVSTASTVVKAVADGLRWYRSMAATPATNPDISVKRYQLVVKR